MNIMLKALRSPQKAMNIMLKTLRRLSSQKGLHLPFWEAGSGYYGNTLGQLSNPVVSGSVEMVLPLLDQLPVRCAQDVITLADYGTNDGYSSMTFMRKVIERLRQKHGQQLAVQILYEDQEWNDFNSLFRRMNDQSSFVHEFPNVYILASNYNFYKQVVPDETCDLILTSNATHWLDGKAPRLVNSCFDVTASEEELSPFRKAAAQCWEKWLLLRAKELKPGGLLVVLSLSAEDQFYDLKRPRTKSELTPEFPRMTAHSVFLDLEDAWRELLEKSVITKDEYHASFVEHALRTRREITQPFDEVTSPVRRAGLNMVCIGEGLAGCPFKSMWREKLEKESISDREFFASRLVRAMRVWGNSSFRSGLDDSRTEDEKDEILDQLYEGFRQRVAASDPATYRSEVYFSRLVAQKSCVSPV